MLGFTLNFITKNESFKRLSYLKFPIKQTWDPPHLGIFVSSFFIRVLSVAEDCDYFTHILAVGLDRAEKVKTKPCSLSLGWSTRRNVVSYLLIFCTPIQSPSTQHILYFDLLWKADIWVSEHLNLKSHSWVIRNKIHLLSQERLSSFTFHYAVCSLLYSGCASSSFTFTPCVQPSTSRILGGGNKEEKRHSPPS